MAEMDFQGKGAGNQMTKKIERIELFHTPKDWNELHAWLAGLSGSERAAALTAAFMAWNLAAKIIEENDDR